MLQKLCIKGYKSFKNLELILAHINILVGANGSGKSNLLSFFDFLKSISKQNLQKFVVLRGVNTLLHKGNEVTPVMSIHLDFINHHGSSFLNHHGYSCTLENGDYGLVFTAEQLWEDGISATHITNRTRESSFYLLVNKLAKDIYEYFKQIIKYHFHDIGRTSSFYQHSNIDNDKYYLYEDGRNLATILYTIKNEAPEIYRLIIEMIQSIAPYFLDFVFNPDKGNNLKLHWKSKDSSMIYGCEGMAGGLIRFIALTTLFLQPNPPAIIIIDEPELGLDAVAITKLASMIKSMMAKGSQVIIATQSAALMNEFKPEDLVTITSRNGESICERLDAVK